MATSVACQLGWGLSDGETIDAAGTRWATVSRFDVLGGASPLVTVPGIMATGGTPLAVTQKGTPGAGVTVVAGSVVVPGNAAGIPPYGLTLTANTDLDITATSTNPRIDLIIARVVNAGTSSSAGTIEVLQGTAEASPARPTLPSGTSHCISLATITIPASTSTITNAMISVVQSDTWSAATSDAFWTAGPGGMVYMPGVMSMSQTRRQAWAALLAPGTPWWDPTSRVTGVTRGGDIVPMSVRNIFGGGQAADVSTSNTTPVTAISTGTLNLVGSQQRLIWIRARGHLATSANADTRWSSVRAYLDGTGLTSIPSTYTQHQARLWGHATNPDAFSRTSFGLDHLAYATSTCSVQVKFLVEGSDGAGPYVCAIKDTFLQVTDLGPAV